jgi:hypothetical protein
VAKEVLRLAGEFGGPTAFAWLQELAGKELHRDVRIALLRALWDHLEHPAAWPILEQAAATLDGRLLNGVLRIPADNLSTKARSKLIDLFVGLVKHPMPTVRLSVLQRFAKMPIPDPKSRLLEQCLPLMTSTIADERAMTYQAILGLATAKDAERIAKATKELLPRRKALSDWIPTVTSMTESYRQRLTKVAQAVLRILHTDPLTIVYQPELTLIAEGAKGLLARLKEVDRFLHADALGAFNSVIASMMLRPDRTDLEWLEGELAASKNDGLRRLAITALQSAAREGKGWTKERRERLERYRGDKSPLVAGSAQFVFPMPE